MTRSLLPALLLALLVPIALPAVASTVQTETLLFIRHAEKPADDLGQISCQGLNRALALPDVLIARFGQPDYLFAPDPARLNHGYSYVRPLATLEPTAIRLGMPVNATFGFDDSGKLLTELTRPHYYKATVWIAWEHHRITEMLRALAGRDVPEWSGSDFDSIAIVTLTRQDGHTTVRYRHENQGLNGLPTRCPGRAGS